MSQALVFTCEHAGNKIPEPFIEMISIPEEVLQSHRGWDPGAMEVATFLSNEFAAPLFSTDVSRLLIEANRSFGSPQLFSEFTRGLPDAIKTRLVEEYWKPYRSRVESFGHSLVAQGYRLVHYSIHSFTPIWNGEVRQVDVGLLYDDERELEAAHCSHLEQVIKNIKPDLKVIHNEPYSGKADGLTTYLRTRFQSRDYLGIEIEINQKFTKRSLKEVAVLLSTAIKFSDGH